MAEFDVSRTVVREALSRLQTQGLVETYRGKGTFVLIAPSPGERTAVAPQTSQSVRDVLEFRIAIETEAAALAALRRSPRQLDELHALIRTFAAARDRPNRTLEADFAFHRSIAAATGNRHFVDTIDALGPTMIAMPRARIDVSPSDAEFQRVVDEHAMIARAIERGSAQDAAAAMRMHLRSSQTRLEEREPASSDAAR